MKKKILLSALTVFSIMIAGKSFGQRYNGYNNNGHYGQGQYREHEQRYNNYDKQEFRSDVRDIQHDQANINYDQRRIEEKQAEINKDLRFHNWFAYRQDQAELQRLYKNLDDDRRDFAFDMKDIRNDGRVAYRH